MSKQFRLFVAAILSVFLLGACALGDGRPPATLYDFGPLKTNGLVQLPDDMPVIRTRVHSPEWMSENLMYYRLNYVNDQQVRFYTESSWNTNPAKLFKNRLDSYLASAGSTVTGFRTTSPTLTVRVYIEDFGQHFTSPSASVRSCLPESVPVQGKRPDRAKKFYTRHSGNDGRCCRWSPCHGSGDRCRYRRYPELDGGFQIVPPDKMLPG